MTISPTGSSSRFTLLEVLATVTILGVVVAAVAGTFHAGLESYRRVDSHGAAVQRVVGGLQLLRRDLAMMSPLGTGNEFGEGRMAFSVLPDEAEPRLTQVIWTWGDMTLSRETAAGEATTSMALLPGLKTLTVEYELDGDWVAKVEGNKRPTAIRLRGMLTEEDVDMPFQTSLLLPLHQPKQMTREAGDDAESAQ